MAKHPPRKKLKDHPISLRMAGIQKKGKERKERIKSFIIAGHGRDAIRRQLGEISERRLDAILLQLEREAIQQGDKIIVPKIRSLRKGIEPNMLSVLQTAYSDAYLHTKEWHSQNKNPEKIIKDIKEIEIRIVGLEKSGSEIEIQKRNILFKKAHGLKAGLRDYFGIAFE